MGFRSNQLNDFLHLQSNQLKRNTHDRGSQKMPHSTRIFSIALLYLIAGVLLLGALGSVVPKASAKVVTKKESLSDRIEIIRKLDPGGSETLTLSCEGGDQCRIYRLENSKEVFSKKLQRRQVQRIFNEFSRKDKLKPRPFDPNQIPPVRWSFQMKGQAPISGWRSGSEHDPSDQFMILEAELTSLSTEQNDGSR